MCDAYLGVVIKKTLLGQVESLFQGVFRIVRLSVHVPKNKSGELARWGG